MDNDLKRAGKLFMTYCSKLVGEFAPGQGVDPSLEKERSSGRSEDRANLLLRSVAVTDLYESSGYTP